MNKNYTMNDFLSELSKYWMTLSDEEKQDVSLKVVNAQYSSEFYEIMNRLVK